jgi:hypothetical protein
VQLFEQTRVGGWEFVILQFVPGNPGESGTPEWLGFVTEPLAAVEAQGHGLFGILVNEAFDQLAYFDFDAQFLAQFSDEAFFEALIWFALAARKFPKPTEMASKRALRHQELSAAKDQARCYIEDMTVVRQC